MDSKLNQIAQVSRDVFGEVVAPQGVEKYNAEVEGGIGIIFFASNIIKLITIAGGFFVMFNIIHAGFIYLSSSGDTGAHAKVRDKITFSILGILVIVASYMGAGLIGLIFFGDATYILNPEICGPEGCES